MLSIKFSILFQSITQLVSMKPAFFITTTLERLLTFQLELLNMERDLSNLKLTRDSIKDGDGSSMEAAIFCKVFWMVSASILLKKRKMLDLRLFNGTKLEAKISNGDQFLAAKVFGKSNQFMPPASTWLSRTILLKMQENLKSITIMDLLKFGESKDTSPSDRSQKIQLF